MGSRIDEHGFLREAPGAGVLYEWAWVGEGTPTDDGDMGYEAVTRNGIETISAGDFVLTMPEKMGQQCVIAQVLSLYERKSGDEEPELLFNARWMYAYHDFTKAGQAKVQHRSKEGRELWWSEHTDDAMPIDCIERKCAVIWVAHDDAEWSRKVEAPRTFFYSWSFDHANKISSKSFSIIEDPSAGAPAAGGEEGDSGEMPAGGEPPPKRPKHTIATLHAQLEAQQRDIAALQGVVCDLSARLERLGAGAFGKRRAQSHATASHLDTSFLLDSYLLSIPPR